MVESNPLILKWIDKILKFHSRVTYENPNLKKFYPCDLVLFFLGRFAYMVQKSMVAYGIYEISERVIWVHVREYVVKYLNNFSLGL